MSEYSQYVGAIAGIFTAASMIPQLFKIIRTKKAENISYFMILILLLGLAGWVWYGILKKDYPVILTNSFSFLLNIVMLGFSIKYKSKS